jgi:retron-type reverse transcriptase
MKFFIQKLDMVVKHSYKGRGFTFTGARVSLSKPILANGSIPTLVEYRNKKIKARMLGPCATVQEALDASSICNRNDLQTCGISSQTLLQLITKVKANRLKSIAVPKYSLKRSSRISHVMPRTVIGFRTRSSVNTETMLNAQGQSKGTELFARNYSTACRDLNPKYAEIVSQELSLLKEHSVNNNIDGVNRCVKSLLGMPGFWIVCYESIKSKPGIVLHSSALLDKQAMTLDIHLDFFHKLSTSILRGSYQFGSASLSPIRADIPKLKGGGIAANDTHSRDKIVQKGLATIMECLSEHRFLECSFGFRRGPGVHEALAYIRKKVPSGLWAIESESSISKSLDRFNHKRLVSLIKKKYVGQQTFIDLIYKALKVKIVSIDSSIVAKIDTPQGSLLSPILCNIYLHELDCYVMESEDFAKYKSSKQAATNSKFTSFMKPSKDELAIGEGIRKAKSKLKMWKYFQKLRISKLKLAREKGIPKSKFKGFNRKFQYIRYAHDFIIFVWGTKNDCLEMKALVKNFLKANLDLDLSEEKTKITYLKKNKAEFLGFQLWQSGGNIFTTKKDVNPIGKSDREKMDSKYRCALSAVPRLRITFSMDKVLRNLVDKGLIRFKAGKYFPTSHKRALHYRIPNIVRYLRAVFLGISNYYGVAHNWYDAKSIYNYYGLFCVAMTIAHKTKSKTPKVFKKYGEQITITNDENKEIAKFGKLSNKDFKKNMNHSWLPLDTERLLKDTERLLKQNQKIDFSAPNRAEMEIRATFSFAKPPTQRNKIPEIFKCCLE